MFPVPAVIQKLDGDGEAVTAPLPAVTRDISTEGLGLIAPDELKQGEKYKISISVLQQESCVVGETMWCEPIDQYYNVGFRVVAVVKPFPKSNANGKTR